MSKFLRKQNPLLWVSLLLFLALSVVFLNQNRYQRSADAVAIDSVGVVDSTDFAFPVHFDYATGIKVENHPDYKELVLFVPDSRDTLASYLLYRKGGVVPKTKKTKTRLLAVPLQSLATLSTTEVGALPLLGLRDILVACANTQNVTDSLIRQRIELGEVQEIGRGMSYNLEQVLALKPNILMKSFSEQTERDELLHNAGIEVMTFNNWKEQTLLGRAEWFKLIGLLYGRNQRADSVFSQIVREYDQAKLIASKLQDDTPILYGQDYKGSWYVPGEYSYVTSMFRDARIRYDFIPGQVSSEPKTLEYIYSKHSRAKIWISMMSADVHTIDEYRKINDRYADFEAVRSGQVWVDRKRVNRFGGNDFWESGPYQPHLLLKDLIKIAHPELLPNYETTYWMQLSR